MEFLIFLIFIPIPEKKTKNKKPGIKPPVTPNSTEKPPLKPLNTGSPVRPAIMYIRTQRVPFLYPSRNPANVMANVWRVAGTPKILKPMGTDDKTAIIDVNTLIMTSL